MKHNISMRESQVLRLIAFEKTSDEIASQLYISHHTAKDHRKALLKKLQVKNAAGLVRRAFELGLLSISEKQFEFNPIAIGTN